MENPYKIEIGVQKSSGHISLRERVNLEENVLKSLVDVLKLCKTSAIMKVFEILDLSEDDRIDYLEIREA